MSESVRPANLAGVTLTRGMPASLPAELGAALLVGLAYYAGSLTGFLFRLPSSGIAYIWPPNAILLASLLLVRPGAWPLVLGAAFAAHGVAHTQDTVPVQTWIWQYLANGVQAVLAAGIILRFCDRPFLLGRLRDIAVFLGGAAFAAPALASLLPAYAYVAMGWAPSFWPAWSLRTLTNVVTTMTLVPPLLVVFREGRALFKGVRVARAGEFIVLLLGLLALDRIGTQIPLMTVGGLSPALFACMPFLAWAAIRFGAAGLSICVLAVIFLSIDALGRDAWLRATPPVETIVGIQLFVSICIAPLMLLSAVLDESRRARRSEEALYHSEVKTTAILKAIPDLMFVQARDSEYRYLDCYAPNADDLLMPSHEFLGKRMRDVLPPDLARSFEDLFEQSVASGEPRVMEYSVPIRGEQRFYEARAVACEDGRLLSIVREITQRKHAEDGLQRAQQELTRMSRVSALGELAASIAHEVRQPLTAIGVNAAAGERWLSRDAPNLEIVRTALTDILEDSRRANQVIARTRALFAGVRRENVPVELNAAISEVLTLTRNRADRQGQLLRAVLDDAPLYVMGDRVQLQQVLMNLIANGLDAMRDDCGADRCLLIRSWTGPGVVHVAVRDTGQGFDDADLDRIFDPFYTTKSDGLGMGLAISRTIIHGHGGTLQATLNAGGGATFEFVLPSAPTT